MIKTIIFDIGNVLMENADSWTGMYKYLPTETDLSLEELDTIWNENWPEISIGKKRLLDFFKEVSKKSKRLVDPQVLLNLYDKSSKVDDSSISIVKELKKSGYRVIVLSNESIEGINFRIKRFGNIFDAIYVSAEIGLKKPDLDIFKFMINKESTLPTKMLFIDDRPENVNAALKCGIQSIVLTSQRDLQSELKKALY